MHLVYCCRNFWYKKKDFGISQNEIFPIVPFDNLIRFGWTTQNPNKEKFFLQKCSMFMFFLFDEGKVLCVRCFFPPAKQHPQNTFIIRLSWFCICTNFVVVVFVVVVVMANLFYIQKSVFPWDGYSEVFFSSYNLLHV
jgi:hypothetical protein